MSTTHLVSTSQYARAKRIVRDHDQELVVDAGADYGVGYVTLRAMDHGEACLLEQRLVEAGYEVSLAKDDEDPEEYWVYVR